jgi:hypothetical protein
MERRYGPPPLDADGKLIITNEPILEITAEPVGKITSDPIGKITAPKRIGWRWRSR